MGRLVLHNENRESRAGRKTAALCKGIDRRSFPY